MGKKHSSDKGSSKTGGSVTNTATRVTGVVVQAGDLTGDVGYVGPTPTTGDRNSNVTVNSNVSVNTSVTTITGQGTVIVKGDNPKGIRQTFR